MPPWARGLWLLRFVRAVGRYVDALHGFLLIAARMRFIRYDDPIDGALQYHGDNAKMCRYPSETDGNYRARISNRWTSKRWAGTGKGVLDELTAFGFGAETTIVADQADSYGYVSGTLTAFEGWFDGTSTNYSHFWIATTSPPWGLGDWGDATDGTWGDGIWGIDGSADQLLALQRAVWESKSVHSLPAEAVLAYTGDVWGGDPSLWGSDGTVYADAETARIPLSYAWGTDGDWGDEGEWRARPEGAVCA